MSKKQVTEEPVNTTEATQQHSEVLDTMAEFPENTSTETPPAERKAPADMTQEELEEEFKRVNELIQGIKFKANCDAEGFKALHTFLTKRVKWSGVNAIAVHDLGSNVNNMYNAKEKTVAFSYNQLDALRFMMQKYESSGLEDATMFVRIMKMIAMPLQEYMTLSHHYSEVETALQAKREGIDVDKSLITMAQDVVKNAIGEDFEKAQTTDIQSTDNNEKPQNSQ